MKSKSPDMDELFSAACDGRADQAQMERLEHELAQDLEVRDDYLAYVDLHASLVDDCIGVDADNIVDFPQRSGKLRTRQVLVATGAGIAAALVFGLVFWISTQRGIDDPGYIAIVTNADGALWEGDDASVMVGSALRPGMVELCEGRVEIELDSGVHIAMEGPARFELINEKHGMLHQGKLSANVPPEGIGFTVDTPSMAVVDLGTEFGLNVNQSASEVHVFDGEVEAILNSEPSMVPSKELITTNVTRRVERSEGHFEAVAFNPDRFTKPPDTLQGVTRVSGGIRVLRTEPETVRKGTFQHNYILLFR
ncbi:MAG: FecR domain-containing protein [Verrucomicrobiota bacterium]